MNSKRIIDLKLSDLPGNDWTNSHLTIIKYVGLKTNLTIDVIIEKLKEYNGDYKKLVNNYHEKEIIEMVIRQTDYSSEEAYNKLVETKGDYMKVINDYIGNNTKKNMGENVILDHKNTNQQIFKEIRHFMDGVNNGYEDRKNINETKKISNTIIENMVKNNNNTPP